VEDGAGIGFGVRPAVANKKERRPDLWSDLPVFLSESKRLPCGGGDGLGSAEFGDDA
jgi:hypothetical protein